MRTPMIARILGALLGATAAASDAAAQQARPAQSAAPAATIPVRVDPPNIDLGDMMPETKKSGEVFIFNLSDRPMNILDVKSTCNCTVPELPSRVIEPRAGIPLKATFESPIFMGPVRRNVYVFIEGYPQPLKIDVDARVNYGVRPLVKYKPEGQHRYGEFSLEDIAGRPFRVVSANFRPPVFLDGFDPAKDPPRSKYLIEVDLRSIPEDQMPKWFLIELDHPTAAVIDMRIMQDPSRPKPPAGPWQLSHERALLWNMKPGESKEIGVTLKNLNPSLPADVSDVKVNNDAVAASWVRFEQTAEGPKAIFRVTPKPGLTGVVFSTISLTCQGSSQSFDVIGRVVPPAAGSDAKAAAP